MLSEKILDSEKIRISSNIINVIRIGIGKYPFMRWNVLKLPKQKTCCRKPLNSETSQNTFRYFSMHTQDRFEYPVNSNPSWS